MKRNKSTRLSTIAAVSTIMTLNLAALSAQATPRVTVHQSVRTVPAASVVGSMGTGKANVTGNVTQSKTKPAPTPGSMGTG